MVGRIAGCWSRCLKLGGLSELKGCFEGRWLESFALNVGNGVQRRVKETCESEPWEEKAAWLRSYRGMSHLLRFFD